MQNNKAFTLTELIVVVVLIMILAVSGFVYYKNYPLEARDSVRIQDIQDTVKSSLELYKSTSGEYPLPTNAETIELDGKKWLSGEFGEEMVGKIKGLEKLPLDPKTKKPYKYLLSENGTNYKIVSELETSKKEYVVTNEKKLALNSPVENNLTIKNCTTSVGIINDGEKQIVYKKETSKNCEQEKGIIFCDNGTPKLENPSSGKMEEYIYKTCTPTNETGDCLASTLNLGGHIYSYTKITNGTVKSKITSDEIDSSNLHGKQLCKIDLKCENGKITQNSVEICKMSTCSSGYYLDASGNCITDKCMQPMSIKSSKFKLKYELDKDLDNLENLKLSKNIKIENGEKVCSLEVQCIDGKSKENSENCQVECNSGYHEEGGKCIYNPKDCEETSLNGIISNHKYDIIELKHDAEKTFNFKLSDDSGKYDYTLTVKCNNGIISGAENVKLDCNPNYTEIVSLKTCKANKLACNITNGYGEKKLNTSNGNYKKCEAIACDLDYYKVPNDPNDDTCDGVGNGYYSEKDSIYRFDCTTGPDNKTEKTTYTYTSDGDGKADGCSWVCKNGNSLLGYHLEGGKCIKNTKPCTIANGTGEYRRAGGWNTGSWLGTCYVTSCNSGRNIYQNACYRRTYSSWGSCNLSCGNGTKYRTATCEGVLGCDSSTKRPTSTSCWAGRCPRNIGNRGSCSVSCGNGTKYRSVTCSGNACTNRPPTSTSCNTHPCEKTFKCNYTGWGDTYAGNIDWNSGRRFCAPNGGMLQCDSDNYKELYVCLNWCTNFAKNKKSTGKHLCIRKNSGNCELRLNDTLNTNVFEAGRKRNVMECIME